MDLAINTQQHLFHGLVCSGQDLNQNQKIYFSIYLFCDYFVQDTFRGRICECPVVDGVQYRGDGYSSCQGMGLNQLFIFLEYFSLLICKQISSYSSFVYPLSLNTPVLSCVSPALLFSICCKCVMTYALITAIAVKDNRIIILQ